MLKNLKHFWQIHLTVALCTAVATGVLAGALLVGDSVRGSLKTVTLERLGTMEHALIAERLFMPELLQRQDMVPAILLNGTVVAPERQTRVSKVNVLGVNDAFFQFWGGDAGSTLTAVRGTGPRTTGAGRHIAINEALQRELNVQVGDALLVNFPQAVDIHPEFLLGQRGASETIQSLRLTVSEVIPTQNGGRFGLRPHQSLPLNAFISLPFLQKALSQEGKVNALFTAEPMPISRSELALTLDALGLKIHEHETHFELQSEQYLLKPLLSDIALSIASENGIPALPTFTYLANTITANGKTVPYSTIVALPVDEETFSVTLADDEILLNTWAADELGVKIGDSIDITYYRIGADEEYITETANFRLKAVTLIQGLAAEQGIIPEFPGIHDTADISEWDSPFPIDYSRIRAQDEKYWDEYRATPKAFITLATGKRLWKNRFGDITSLRMRAAPAMRAQFESALLEKIQPEQVGFQFLSLRADGFQAAAGTTDFGMLFSGLSILIILSVAYLLDMLFRIGVEQRSREIGILRAVGYPLAKIRLRFLSEAGILAGAGTLIGCVFAIGYAQLMLFGLNTWWLPAIGTPFVELHVRGVSLLIGVLISLGVVLFSIQITIRGLGKSSTASLLAGVSDFSEAGPRPETPETVAQTKKYKRFGNILAFCLVILIGIMAVSFKEVSNFLAGLADNPIFVLLTTAITTVGVGGLAFDRWLTSQKVPKHLTRLRFALKNAARHPGHSKGCVTMVSLACCIVVAVGVNRQAAPPQTGYAFVAEAALPLHHNLNTEDGRFELGFSDKNSELLSQSEVIPFRVLPGEDVSCLNLYQPQKPQILGISDAVLDENPWRETRPRGDKVVAIADENSVRWVLHLQPEDELVVEDEFGNPLGLHLHTVQNSLFQGQLIISESNFIKFFPSQSGYRYFLIKTPPELREETARVLEKTLDDYGFDVTSASARLASYRNVANTYISTFQSLGGLGVILGTFGLALVLFRNVLERRGELATLRAFGFRRSLLSRMLFLESTFLLVVGMLIGIAAGLVSPIVQQGHLPALPWSSLTITLLSIFVFGIIANAVAVAVALRSPLLATLKSSGT